MIWDERTETKASDVWPPPVDQEANETPRSPESEGRRAIAIMLATYVIAGVGIALQRLMIVCAGNYSLFTFVDCLAGCTMFTSVFTGLLGFVKGIAAFRSRDGKIAIVLYIVSVAAGWYFVLLSAAFIMKLFVS